MVDQYRDWNYVHCIESVADRLSKDGPKSIDECWKMQTACRNVFQSEVRVYSLDPAAVVLATISGLLCSLLVYVAIRGGFQNMRRRRSVEFTSLNTDASID